VYSDHMALLGTEEAKLLLEISLPPLIHLP
jgi:hypothetical protein